MVLNFISLICFIDQKKDLHAYKNKTNLLFLAAALKTSRHIFFSDSESGFTTGSNLLFPLVGNFFPSLGHNSPSDDLLHDDGHQDGEEGQADNDHEGPLVVRPGFVIFLQRNFQILRFFNSGKEYSRQSRGCGFGST